MRIHPLLITTFVTVGIAGASTGIYRHHLVNDRVDAVKRITESTGQLTGLLRAAAAVPSDESLRSISSITEQATGSFHDVHVSASARKSLFASIVRAVAEGPKEQDGILQRTYILFRSAEREARIRMQFASATEEILKYDVDDDLRGITPEFDSRDVMQRMYLAKGGLRASRDELKQALALGEYASTLNQLIDSISEISGIIDGIILATDMKSFANADTALAQYRKEMKNLNILVRATAKQLDASTVFRSLAGDAESLMPRLVEITR